MFFFTVDTTGTLWQYGVWMSFWHFQNFGKLESDDLNEIKMKSK